MQLLFPSDPFNKRCADEAYVEEFDAATALGLRCSLFSFEDFEAGNFSLRPALHTGEPVLYRGWMLTPDGYATLHDAISAKGSNLRTSSVQYRHCHYLPEWYALCSEFTPETVVVPRDADFVVALDGKDWPAYFVKDYVKSLTTQRGSVAATPQDVAGIVSLIEQFRGKIDGGVCIRKFENFLPETEERYFVLNGQAYGRNGEVPGMVHALAKRIESPFFSADLVFSDAGELRLIELGDGQVSDRKKWTATQFVAMLREERQVA